MIGFDANATVFGIETNATFVRAETTKIKAQSQPSIAGIVEADGILTRGALSEVSRAVRKETQLSGIKAR